AGRVERAAGWRLKGAAAVFIAWFLCSYVYVGLAHKQQRRYTFPFTSFPMYCSVFADPPYDSHAPYVFGASRWEFEFDDADNPYTTAEIEAFQATVRRRHFSVPWTGTFDECLTIIPRVLAYGKACEMRDIRTIRMYKTVYQICPYPEARVVPVQAG